MHYPALRVADEERRSELVAHTEELRRVASITDKILDADLKGGEHQADNRDVVLVEPPRVLRVSPELKRGRPRGRKGTEMHERPECLSRAIRFRKVIVVGARVVRGGIAVEHGLHGAEDRKSV